MADVAAHLVDEVFPEVPVRQWVCSLPWRLRHAMGYDRKLCADVLDVVIVALRRSLRLRARVQLGLRSVEDPLFGAITFIQRADSSLRLNVHFHCLVLDGVYVRDGEGELRFHSLGTPTSEEVTDVARWTHERLGRVLERRGRSLDELACDDTPNLLAQEQPALASCYGASVADRRLLGDAPGQRTREARASRAGGRQTQRGARRSRARQDREAHKIEKPKIEKPKDDAKPEPPGAPAGYTGHLASALTELGAGEAVSAPETTAYGCSVKYADAGAEAAAVVGQPAPAFTLPKLDGEQVSLADFAGKTVVLEWFNPDCPFVKYAHGEGPLATLGNQQHQGVVWLAITSGAPGKQGAGAERNRQAKAEWKLEHPILIDEDGAVGHSYGAKTTPHMFVTNPAGELVYAGGLDNAPLGRVDG